MSRKYTPSTNTRLVCRPHSPATPTPSATGPATPSGFSRYRASTSIAGISATPATYGHRGPRHSESYGNALNHVVTAAAAAAPSAGIPHTRHSAATPTGTVKITASAARFSVGIMVSPALPNTSESSAW